MGHLTLVHIGFLLVMGFLSAFIDATVGGGGLVSVPALLTVGLPPALALGTNKLAGTLSSFTSSLSFWTSGKVNVRLVSRLFPFSFIGSVIGADLARHLSSSFLRPMVVCLLIAVTLYTLFKRRLGATFSYRGLTRWLVLLAAVTALVIGFYDGFFGPGTGSFLIMAFVMIGFDFVQASGNAKVLNFASNLGALITFALLRSIQVEYGLIMGIGMIIGAISGSRVAIRYGVRYVRPLFICITVVLIGHQLLALL